MQETRKNIAKRVIKILLILLVVISLGLPLLTTLILNIPFVRHQAQKAVINYLSNRSSLYFSLDDLEFKHNTLHLRGLLAMDDVFGDTLLNLGQVDVRVSSLLKSLWNRRPVLHDVLIADGYVKVLIKQNPVDTLTKTSAKSPWRIDLENLQIIRGQLVIEDQKNNTRYDFKIPKGEAKLYEFDLIQKKFKATKLHLLQPDIVIIKQFAPEDTSPDDTTVSPLLVSINELLLDQGTFIYHDLRFNRKISPGLDPHYIEVDDLFLSAKDLSFDQELSFNGDLDKLTARTRDGQIQLTELSCPDFVVTADYLNLPQLSLRTDESYIGDSISATFSSYQSFKDIASDVFWAGRLTKSMVSIRELIYFLPALREKDLFKDHSNQSIAISVALTGSLNRLNLVNLSASFDNKINLSASGNLRNAFNHESEPQFNLKFTNLKSSITFLKQIIPGFNLPENFNRLGQLSFKGQFDGYLSDFVTFGEIQTDLGKAKLDMRLDATEGRDLANYSGRLQILDFNMGKWLNSSDLGLASVDFEVNEGKGLRLRNIQADVTAYISQFQFRDYNYRNGVLSGQFIKNSFSGDFAIADENIDLSFRGLIDFSDSLPTLDFIAKIERLHTEPLHITKQPFFVSGEVGIIADALSLNRPVGKMTVKNLVIEDDDENIYQLNSFLVQAAQIYQQSQVQINSDIINGTAQGTFNVFDILPAFQMSVKEFIPVIANKIGWDTLQKTVRPVDVEWSLTVENAKNWFDLLGVPGLRLLNTQLNGLYNNQINQFGWYAQADQIGYDNQKWDRVLFSWKGLTNSLIQLQADSHRVSNKIVLTGLGSSVYLEKENLRFQFNTLGIVGLLDKAQVSGNLYLPKEGFNIRIDTTSFPFLDGRWVIEEPIDIALARNMLQIKKFKIFNHEQIVTVKSENGRALSVELQKIPMGLLDSIWRYDKLNFSGEGDLFISVSDVFEWKNFNLKAQVNKFAINGDDFGQLFLSIGQEQKNQPRSAYLKVENRRSRLTANGYLHPPADKDGYTRVVTEWELKNYPIKIAEYFLGSGISQTKGVIDSKFTISGFSNNLKIAGSAKAFNGETKVNYLGTKYFFHDQVIKINEKLFDFSAVQISDELGNRASVTGGIYHDHFRKPGVNIAITAPKALALNTTKKDNNLFYGRGIGRVNCTFNGPFNKIDIYVNAIASAGTKVSIPISSNITSSGKEFISFVKLEQLDEQRGTQKPQAASGLDLKIDLTLTPDAEASLIFDEYAGDILRGNGRADLQISLARSGKFEMRGLYEIEHGDYLFTLFNVINKPFNIRRGGTIFWTGDPYNAEINIDAEYRGLNTSLSSFLLEYRDQLREDINQTTPVQLILHLNGALLRPDITFDITFPDLTTELKTFADAKISLLKSDPNALNQQVFGLIVLGSFIPSNSSPLTNQFLSNSSVNTISQLLSNQLSLLVSNILSEAISPYAFITDLKFNVGLNLNPQLTGPTQGVVKGSEVEFSFNSRFFDDRLGVVFGANIINESPLLQKSYVTGDVAVDVALTSDRRLKLRFYQKPVETIQGLQNKFGLGLTYRKEFDSFFNLSKDIKNSTKEKTNLDGGPRDH